MDSLWNVFLNTVTKYPQKIAVADQKSKYTYEELFEKVKSITSLLAKYKTKKPIIIFAGRDIDTIAQILAVIGSGNYYIPLDSSLPKVKLEAILNDAKPVAILGKKEDFKMVKELNYKADFYTVSDKGNEEAKFAALKGAEPLYMVYTSGSTGKPKGVLKSHSAVLSFLKTFSDLFPFEEDTIIGNQAPLFFDASAKDLYLSIYNGATLEIIPTEKFVLPVGLINYLNERKINWICWVPSALYVVSQLNTFMEVKPKYLRRVFFVGEVFPIKQLNKWIENLPNVKFTNLYGSSEIAGVCCYYEVNNNLNDMNVLPLGKALPNCDITLRNENQIIKDSNVTGEIFICSPALALGYYNDEEKTKSVFFKEGNNRIFQSGDLAYYDEDGNLCFVSRKDYQIKHKGRRIELGEIETACDNLSEINKSCCLYDEKRKMITLFCEPNKKDLTSQEIKNLLKDKVADYMIPDRIKLYERLPLNANGKIDRQALKATLTERSI